jgi:hypothetical protein
MLLKLLYNYNNYLAQPNRFGHRLIDYDDNRHDVQVHSSPCRAPGALLMNDTLITRLPKCEMHIHIEGKAGFLKSAAA